MKLQEFGLREIAAILFLALPIVLPPYIQYTRDIQATTTLGIIIVSYLPVWFYLNYLK